MERRHAGGLGRDPHRSRRRGTAEALLAELAIELRRRGRTEWRAHHPALATEHQIPARRELRLLVRLVGGSPLIRDEVNGASSMGEAVLLRHASTHGAFAGRRMGKEENLPGPRGR